MVAFRGMDSSAFRRTALVGLAFLVILPNRFVFAATLREEAASYRTKGYDAQQRGDVTEAMSYYRKAAELDPTYPTPHNDLGILLEGQSRFKDAEGAYRQALALRSNFLEAHTNLAMLYERMGQQEKAIAHWMTRYQLGDPSDPWTLRAEERLRALGALKQAAGLSGRIVSRQHVTAKEFEAHEQSLEEFHALTEKRRD